MIKHTIYIFFPLFQLSAILFGQNGGSENLLSYMKTSMRFMAYYPHEKAYLHLDNTGYFKGERIYFKAYVVRCDTERRTDLSRVLYVELLSPSGDVVERSRVALENGEGHGDISLENILLTGFYEIRAYTRYMTNWGTHACFSRVIPIFKAPSKPGDYSSPTIDRLSYRKRLNDERMSALEEERLNIHLPDSTSELSSNKKSDADERVRFFPEGGDLVGGLPARVAFTVRDSEGLPLVTKGRLTDGDGNTLDTFTTDSEGRASVHISSCGGKEILLVDDGKGHERRYRLPEAKPEGCTMRVDMMRDDSLTVDIYASDGMKGRQLGYVLMNKGTVVRCDTLTAVPYVCVRFNRERLPDGVSQLTLFDSGGQVLSERLFFIFPKDAPSEKVEVTCKSESLTPCGKVQINLKSVPESSLSFSVVDAAGMVNGRNGDIRAWMLLGSEVRGYIARPWYYLESDDKEHRQAADLLMLTQGWRRYDWRMLSGQSVFERFQPIEDRLYLFGKVRSRSGGAVDGLPLAVTLYSHEGKVVEGDCMTDSVGGYAFHLPDISGEWNLQFRARRDGRKKKDYSFSIDRHFAPAARHIGEEETRMVPVDTAGLLRWSQSERTDSLKNGGGKWEYTLDNVNIRARRVWDRTSWRDETNARLHSVIYYDCDEAVDRLADEGQFPPSVMGWLKTKNSFFSGNDDPQSIRLMKKNEGGLNQPDTVNSIEDWFPMGAPAEFYVMPPAPWKIFYDDGLKYKNRPVVWIIDNLFTTITGFKYVGSEGVELVNDKWIPKEGMQIHMNYCDNYSNTVMMPETLDEFKCIYISEDYSALQSHIRCNEIGQMQPVVVYGFTHPSYLRSQKGLRRTHFQGYNIPTKFEMKDYGVVPPVSDDFRRTLNWNPDVRTDKDGNATIEFWNNSTCRDMYISVEGMTEDGQFMNN